MDKKNWFLYLVRTHQNALYCGITTDVAKRFQTHCDGKGAKSLKGKLPLTLVYQCQVGDRACASRIEYRIKQLTKMKKEQLVIDQPLNVIAYLTLLLGVEVS